jgi:hypothetical protein
MTASQQILALAALEGWHVSAQCVGKNLPSELEFWTRDEKEFRARNYLDNYTVDLNAIHRIEKLLTPFQKRVFPHCLSAVVFGYEYVIPYEGQFVEGHFEMSESSTFKVMHATAAQRAEAVLRTLGKWQDAEDVV